MRPNGGLQPAGRTDFFATSICRRIFVTLTAMPTQPSEFHNKLEGPLQLPTVQWHDSPIRCVSRFAGTRGEVRLRYGIITSGPGSGIQVVEIDTGPMQIILLPGRGMSIWQIMCDGIPFKWNSPVCGPIHPAMVPVCDSGGVGWLEGFDEFLVRCGLVSNGAPDFDQHQRCLFPLHGRVGNLPASRIWCEADEDGIAIVGQVHETRLFCNRLTLDSKLRVEPGSRLIEIHDVVTNLGSSTSSTQMLYHINTGRPVLDGGSELIAPIQELAPRDARASEDIAGWSDYQPPTTGYKEVVYFCRLASDKRGMTSVMLRSSDKNSGLGIQYDTISLPWFVVWKNTADERDGYVTGLEPATNFPNRRSFESQQGRVVELKPNESITYRLTICPLVGSEPVKQFKKQVDRLAQSVVATIHPVPVPGWSPPTS